MSFSNLIVLERLKLYNYQLQSLVGIFKLLGELECKLLKSLHKMFTQNKNYIFLFKGRPLETMSQKLMT